MPAFPFPALDDVEGANQRAYSQNMQFVAMAGQRAADNAIFVTTQSQQQFLQSSAIRDALALQLATNVNNPTANDILTLRSVRDQPNVSPTIAFVPTPLSAENPGAAPSPTK